MPGNLVLRSLVRHWWLVLAFAAAGAGIGASYTLAQPAEYTAAARIYVSVQSGDSVSDLTQGNVYGQQLVDSYAALSETPYILEPTIRKLGLRVAPERLARDISTSTVEGSSILTVEATAKSPKSAAELADGIADQLAAAVPLLTPTSNSGATVKLTKVQGGAAAISPAGTRALTNVALAGLLGLATGAAILAARARVDTRLRSVDEIQRAVDLPVLGTTFYEAAAARGDSIQAPAPGTAAEAYQFLRTSISFLDVDRPARTLLVTSAVAGEGKSTTVLKLAIAFAEAGSRVIVVDADLRRPSIAAYTGLVDAVGLTDVLRKQVTVEEGVQPWGQAEISVLTAGSSAPNPGRLLESEAMTALVASLIQTYDYVILDTPPVLAAADALLLAPGADATIVVVSESKARRPQIVNAVQRLMQVKAALAGVVVTMVRPGRVSSYGYAYEYPGENRSEKGDPSSGPATPSE